MTAPLTILGGGPAGLATAYYAHRAERPFALYERGTSFGGLCQTLRAGRHRYDSGAHRFHDQDAEITADLKALLGDALRPVSAPSQIVDGGRFVDFPPTPLGLLLSGGLQDAGRIGLELLTTRLRRHPEPRNFAEFANMQFGPSLARRYLLDYSEKLWGLPADQLSPDVATRRLGGMTVWTLLAELFRPDQKTRHLDGKFFYPDGGYGAIADALAGSLPLASLHAGVEIDALEIEDGIVRALGSKGRAIEVAGPIVWTLPLTLLVRLAGAHVPEAAREAASSLRFRDVRLVFLRLSRPSVSPNASVYVPDPARLVTRLYEPRNRSNAMAPEGETSLVAEVPCFPGDPVHDLAEEALIRRTIHEIASLDLIEPADVVETRHHFLRNAYPVYERGYQEKLQTVIDGVSHLGNVHLLGRGGQFFYSHLHDQMRAARDFVDALPKAAAHAAAGA